MAIAHGVRTIEVIRRVAPHLDAEAEARQLRITRRTISEGVVVMPGAVESGAARFPMDAGAWSPRVRGLLATSRLRYCGLPVPEVLVTSDDVTQWEAASRAVFEGGGADGVRVRRSAW